MFIRTRLTNNTETNRAYAWFPGGLTLVKGKSIILDYDPLSRVTRDRGFAVLAQRDVNAGAITVEYLIAKPCKVVDTFSKDKSAEIIKRIDKPAKKRPKITGVIEEKEVDNTGLDIFTADTTKEELADSVAVAATKPKETFDIDPLADLVTVAGTPKKKPEAEPVVEEKPAKEEPKAAPKKRIRKKKAAPKVEEKPAEDKKNTF